VTPAWLDAKLREQPDSGRRMHVLDCTWYLPSAKKDPLDEFVRRGRLHGAKFFDLDAIADQGTTLPHMLCSPQAFGAAMDALGISTHDDVVCYDRQGIFSAPRAWWTFQAFGHQGTVSVLDGGLPAWRNEFGPEYMMETAQIDRGEVERPGRVCGSYVAGDPVRYEASLQTHLVKRLSDVVATYENNTKEIVVDARPAARWQGIAPEPRPGLPSGHVPNSKNIPWDAVLETVDHGEETYRRFKSADEIRRAFLDAGLDDWTDFSDVIASCGSGTTACILVLASEQLQGKTGLMSVYDGSWSEYGASGARIDDGEV
jgi:thiosulfate/3-mercaptopyruvate sulfurtransferase